eukprot:759510-Hanusia_phi.AAC.3
MHPDRLARQHGSEHTEADEQADDRASVYICKLALRGWLPLSGKDECEGVRKLSLCSRREY